MGIINRSEGGKIIKYGINHKARTKQEPRSRAERRKEEKWERGATSRKRIAIMQRAEIDQKELKRQGREKRIDAVRDRTAKIKADAKKVK